MQIGNINFRKRLSHGERMRRIENNLCFICAKPNCIARNHKRNNRNRYNGGNRYHNNTPVNQRNNQNQEETKN